MRWFLVFALLSAPAAAQTMPDRATLIARAEAAVKAELVDPDSAKFTWTSGNPVYGPFQELGTPKYTGWIICGTVNAQNSFGGYAGKSTVVAIVDDSGGANAVIEDGYNSDAAAEKCAKHGMPV